MAADEPRPRSSIPFAAAVFVSAFLLFAIQPLISKTILPWFGGSSGVWTVCLLVFQLLLFCGYCYAHAVATWLPGRLQAILHLLLTGTAAVLVTAQPDPRWRPQPGEPPEWRIALLLLATIGLPYFVLSTTGPLLQAWFSRALPGRSPYRLYALSNAGSLLALGTYPFLVEPLLPLHDQAGYWSIGFRIFAALGAICAAVMLTVRGIRNPVLESPSLVDVPTPGRSPLWFLLALVPSAALLAITNYVGQDAVAPFLWVLPLGLYLLSFILCFDSDRWYRRRSLATVCGLILVATALAVLKGTKFSLAIQASLNFAALFALCMVCHGELARLRPAPSRLTRYYLTISGGGAVGGLFVAVIAPTFFNAAWEYYGVLLIGLLISIFVLFDSNGWFEEAPPFMARVLAIACVAAVGVVIVDAALARRDAVAGVRNFYGILTVERENTEPFIGDAGGSPIEAMVLRHGRITHGLQYLDAAHHDVPAAYYGPVSGVGRTFEMLKRRKPELRVGVVGLGVGTLASYGRAGDQFRFYEINSAVEPLARKYFTFLSDTLSKVDVIPGDARLSLEAASPQEFDLLVVDAFSGDAIPTHLLTREAMRIYRKHLKPDGICAFHISNLHFDLRPVVYGLASQANWKAVTILNDVANGGEFSSLWALTSADETALREPEIGEVSQTMKGRPIMWTDDFTNVLSVLE
jgi:hypothetical protein